MLKLVVLFLMPVFVFWQVGPVFSSPIERIAIDHHPFWFDILQHDSHEERDLLVHRDEKGLIFPPHGPMFTAAAFGYSDIVEMLASDSDVLATEGTDALYIAASLGRLTVVSVLLDAGVDINAGVWTGESALFGAVKFADIKTICMLVTRGADVNRRIVGPLSLLAEATLRQRPDIVELLLGSGYEMQKGEYEKVLDMANRLSNAQLVYILKRWHNESVQESASNPCSCGG